MSKKFANEDPLQSWKQYGIIQNQHVKRRTTKRPPPTAAPIMGAAPTKVVPKADNSINQAVLETRKAIPKPTTSSKPATASAKPNPPSKLLKRESSDLFKSFAKSKPPKPKKEDTQDSIDSTPGTTQDSAMVGMSDEEGEEDDPEQIQKDNAKAELLKKERQERQAKLKAMMDEEEEDEVMADAPAEDKAAEVEVDEHADDGAALDKQKNDIADEQETVTVAGGRRRGRRRIMKKKTVQDEEGYLVTTEEPAWESFSEDEPQPKKQKLPAMSSTASQKAKKAGKGQGNIMNFFGKK